LIEHGQAALRDSLPPRDAEAVRLFREAAALAPGLAAPWGWLALALRRVAIRARPDEAEGLYKGSEDAARRALAIDPREANARVVWAHSHEQLNDPIAAEDNLRAILADSPDNIGALNDFAALLQAVGRRGESWDVNERALALEPLAVIQQQRRALKHWIFGRPTEADRTVDGALRRWPRHPLLWNARLWIYAFTGRPQAALTLIGDAEVRPREETPAGLEVWRASVTALHTRRPADIELARDANIAAAMRTPGAAATAIMILSSLLEIDTAYSVAEGFLLRRGPIVAPPSAASGQALAQDPRWRQTQWLFTPATQPLRDDPRFPRFCEDIGLADYWRRRGIGPDILSR
jgi:tetratricopeptide (TPR) repeat protein